VDLEFAVHGKPLGLAIVHWDPEPRLEGGADCQSAVSQVANLLAVRRARSLSFDSTLRRLAVDGTAGWQPALQGRFMV